MLQNAFEFTASDLDVNRSGTLTDWQRSLLCQKQSKLLLLAIFSIVALIIVFLAFPHPVIRLVSLLCLGGLLVFFFNKWQTFSRDMQNSVYSVKGWASKRKMGRNAVYYLLDIGGEIFVVNRSQYEWLMEGAQYRIYYVPHSRTILSVEEVHESDQPLKTI